MRKSMATKALAMTSTAALAGGILLVGAGQANAANSDFKKLSAPKTVMAGETFVLNCKVKKAWAGAEASLMEKGAEIQAHRMVASNGDCSMHVVLNATGARKIKVTVAEGDEVTVSKWVKVTVEAD